MGFLQNLLRNREKQQLEEAVVAAPTPEAFMRLAQLYRGEGELAKARQVLKRGTSKFPNDKGLAEAEQDVVKLDRDAEIARLRQQLDRFPNRGIYARLADLLRLSGKMEEAGSVVNRGLKEYPEYGGLYYVQGELAVDSGNEDEAFDALTKAVSLEKYNYAALKTLGRVATALGRHAAAVSAYERIAEFAPDDLEIRQLRAAAEASTSTAPADEGSVATEPAGGTGQALESAPPTAAQPDAQKDYASEISAMVDSKIVQAVVLADNYGSPLAACLPNGADRELMAATVWNIRSAAGPVCGELGLGSFEELILDCHGGTYYLYAIREMTLAVLAAPGARQAAVERVVTDFVNVTPNFH